MDGFKSGLRTTRVLALLAMGMAATLRAQLIPLLPPLPNDTGEEATPQLSKTAQAIQDDLVAERFDELDRMADQFRRTKRRTTGGGWRLRQFYGMLDPKQPSDEAMEEHLKHIEHWIAAKPQSITAQVAMAQSLHRWAWMARGGGLANTVTPAMATLFFQRVGREQGVLEDAKKLPVMCPQWYSEMMSVGLAEGWDRPKMQALFDEATAFEPGWLSYYRDYANYLLPKWLGEDGDAEKFAKEAADKVGGDMGDLVYYEVATVVIKRGNGGIPTQEMNWERIKRGAYALDRMYGPTRGTTNEFAFMAYKYQDYGAAVPLFESIGDRWLEQVWKSRAYYERARKWARTAQAAEKAVASQAVAQ